VGADPGHARPGAALILIALLAVATEALRRQVGSEYPGADVGEAVERLRERAVGAASRARHGTWRVVSEARTRTRGGSPGGDRLERLERLKRLKETGVLDEREFAAQKRLILEEAEQDQEPGDGTAPPVPAPG